MGTGRHEPIAIIGSGPAGLASALPPTREQVEQAYMLGRVLHRIPKPLRAIRDLALDHTPFLQRQVGDKTTASIEAQLVEMGADNRHPAAA